jgi:hypothetical protein
MTPREYLALRVDEASAMTKYMNEYMKARGDVG